MGDSFDKIGGVIVGALLVIGLLLFSGVIEPKSEALVKILHFAGVAALVIFAIIVLLIIVVFVAARKSSNVDENQNEKVKINHTINENRQQLSKLKSKTALLNMKLGTVNSKITELDNRIKLCEENAKKYLVDGDEEKARMELNNKNSIMENRKNLVATQSEYKKNLDELQSMIDRLDDSITSIENRRDDALTRLDIANTKKMINEYSQVQDFDNIEALNNLEDKAQYEDDYANALNELKRGGRTE